MRKLTRSGGLAFAQNFKKQSLVKKANPTDICNYFVLAYSPTQNAYHIETLREHLENNIIAFARNRLQDFNILSVYETYDKAVRDLNLIKSRLA